MRQFKIKPGGFQEIKKKLIIRTIPIMIIILVAGITISTINSSDSNNQINVLGITILLGACALGFGMYRGIKRQKELFESFTLTLSNNLIRREQLNTPTISIYFNDISEIVKNKNGSFSIKGKSNSDLIIVPLQINDYNALEVELEQIKPIGRKEQDSFLQKNQSILSLLTVGLMVIIYTATNVIVVGICGSLLVAWLLYSFFGIRRNKNIDTKTKNNMGWIWLVIASVIGVMIFKLVNS